MEIEKVNCMTRKKRSKRLTNSLSSVIVRVSVVLKRTLGDSD